MGGESWAQKACLTLKVLREMKELGPPLISQPFDLFIGIGDAQILQSTSRG
jgi:hypothetical protein